ncbi:MAG: hypothetical protein SO314_04790 [Alphaproteobacteria bacterium]|nr:hypothetical protein [Alphaproteobacteria bacterium]
MNWLITIPQIIRQSFSIPPAAEIVRHVYLIMAAVRIFAQVKIFRLVGAAIIPSYQLFPVTISVMSFSISFLNILIFISP